MKFLDLLADWLVTRNIAHTRSSLWAFFDDENAILVHVHSRGRLTLWALERYWLPQIEANLNFPVGAKLTQEQWKEIEEVELNGLTSQYFHRAGLVIRVYSLGVLSDYEEIVPMRNFPALPPARCEDAPVIGPLQGSPTFDKIWEDDTYNSYGGHPL